MTRQPNRSAMTLIELLVVIFIIGLLISLLIPAVQAARESGRRAVCKNNLHQFGLALHSYHQNRGHLPPGWIGPTGWGWTVYLLPYMERTDLYDGLGVKDEMFRIVEPPDAGTELDMSLTSCLCPSAGPAMRNPNYSHDGSVGYWKSNYAAVNGGRFFIENSPGKCRGLFGLDSKVTFAEIRDGQANTFAVGERAVNSGGFRGAIWIRAINQVGNFIYPAAVAGITDRRVPLNHRNGRNIGFNSLHAGGAQFLMAEGSVRFVPDTIDTTVYMYLGNKADRQIVEF